MMNKNVINKNVINKNGDEAAVVVEKKGRIVQLTLNRPETRNAISDKTMVESLVKTLKALDADPEINVLILTGAGKSFCSGGNIKHMANREDMFAGDAAQLYQNYREGIQTIPLMMQQLQVPVIAAVNGAAYGAGVIWQ